MNERRSIMGACEYSINALQNIKKGLSDIGNSNMELTWAIGGIVIALMSQLMRICDEVLNTSIKLGEPDARIDLMEIRNRFNSFIDGMMNHE